MTFICKYTGHNQVYYRTVYADNHNDATKRAERYAKKGFMLAKVESIQMDKYA